MGRSVSRSASGVKAPRPLLCMAASLTGNKGKDMAIGSSKKSAQGATHDTGRTAIVHEASCLAQVILVVAIFRTPPAGSFGNEIEEMPNHAKIVIGTKAGIG